LTRMQPENAGFETEELELPQVEAPEAVGELVRFAAVGPAGVLEPQAVIVVPTASAAPVRRLQRGTRSLSWDR
jgi:hypothetical protein